MGQAGRAANEKASGDGSHPVPSRASPSTSGWPRAPSWPCPLPRLPLCNKHHPPRTGSALAAASPASRSCGGPTSPWALSSRLHPHGSQLRPPAYLPPWTLPALRGTSDTSHVRRSPQSDTLPTALPRSTACLRNAPQLQASGLRSPSPRSRARHPQRHGHHCLSQTPPATGALVRAQEIQPHRP